MSKGTLEAEFGRPSFKKKNYYKQVDGDVIFRIIPPLEQFTDNPRDWAKFHSVVFGFKNTQGKIRAFESTLVEKYDNETKTRTVETPCPAVDFINNLKDKLEEAEKAGNTAAVAKLNTLVGMMGVYSVDRNYHMNVIDLQGNIGILKIRSKAKAELDKAIEKLKAKGVNPLSLDNGRFFVFSRSGRGGLTNYQVTEYKESVERDGETLDKSVVHKITPELLAKINEEAVDLANGITTKLTVSEIQKIVKTVDILTGKSSACDEFFDARWKAKRTAAKVEAEQDNDGPNSEDAPPAKTQTAPTGTIGLGAGNPGGGTDAITVTGSTIPTSTTTVKAAPAALNTPLEELPDADFFAIIGVDPADTATA